MVHLLAGCACVPACAGLQMFVGLDKQYTPVPVWLGRPTRELHILRALGQWAHSILSHPANPPPQACSNAHLYLPLQAWLAAPSDIPSSQYGCAGSLKHSVPV